MIWLHAISDSLIGAAFFATASFLALLVWHRRDLQFTAASLGFGIYIMACGVIRLLSVLTLWVPAYRIEGAIKGSWQSCRSGSQQH